LAAAAADFNSVGSGLINNYTFFIGGNLTEPNNLFFGKPTNGKTLTFKPSPSVTPTITFTGVTDNAGTSGHWLFGVTGLASTSEILAAGMPNIVIDGSNTVGGTTRDLTVQNTTADGPLVASDFPRVINIVGDCDNAVVKNVIIKQLSQVVSNTNSVYALLFQARTNTAAPVGAFYPDDMTVENCQIISKGTRAATGVGFTLSGAVAGAAIKNAVVRNCDFDTQHRCILLNGNSTHTVELNRFSFNQSDPNSAFITAAIASANANGVSGWTATYSRNKFLSMDTLTTAAASGIAAIQASGAPAATGTKYIIENNTIAGFNFGAPISFDGVYRAIETASSFSVMDIRHNSINMPNFANVSGATVGQVGVVTCGSTNVAHNFNFVSNVVRCSQANGRAFFQNSATAPTSNNNNIFAPGITTFATVTPTNYVTFANWQGAGFDVASTTDDPTDNWVSATDLHLNAAPPAAYNVALLAAVPKDIDGATRSATTNKGADQFALNANVGEWSVY
jgi:hypothetical protein